MRSKRDAAPRERDSQDRVPALPSSHPVSAEAPTGSHVSRVFAELPASWLDRLLLVATSLPIQEGETAVARAVVEALASMLPDHGVGACLVTSHAAPPQFVRAMPQGEEHRAAGSDPTRMFTGYPFERAAEIGGGSTLHVASLDGSCEDERSPVASLLDRAALIARRGIEQARDHLRAQATVAGAASELQSLHSHMVQAEKLASLGQIAAGVVHELNNPLTSIVAYTDFLIRKVEARGDAADRDEVDRLRRIADSAGRMLRFTRDLVSYARPSSEIPVQVSVHIVIDQALAFCEHVLHEAGVEVDRRFASHVPLVRGKPEQLAQVFVNLVTNACHAMPKSGAKLVVTTEAEGDHVVMSIADNGHGILPQHMAHVFAPFFTTKGSGVGTGLGLTIVKSIVDGHHGTIQVQSVPGSGGGTTFTITLPAALR